MTKKSPVCVMGAGSWGTALAMVLARHGRDVRLLARCHDSAKIMQQQRQNPKYLAGIQFPDSLRVTGDQQQSVEGVAAVVLALPCHVAESVAATLTHSSIPVIAACKGINPNTLERVDQWLIHHLGRERITILSGPSFAKEVAEGSPTAITLAGHDKQVTAKMASLFDDSSFRIYCSDDLVAVTLGGALKNVIAIAAGIADGLKLGHNATAALITRGITEISRLSIACGGRPETISGLAGLGDLVLTCTGALSRNRQMGLALAKGMDRNAARNHIGQTVEGEHTAAAACKLAARHHVDMPICHIVQCILQQEISPQDGVKQLLARPERREGL
ncbi:MAG: NAD(P)H-dependent glycerol-3-phosphate dehydrogenase [Mariprofundaceae bacterium]